MNPNPSSIIPMITVSLPRVGTRRRRVRPAPRSRPRRAPTCSCHPRPGAATCHPKLVSHICTFVQELRSDLHLCTSYPAPVPEPDNPYPTPDCRDLRPENVWPQLIIRSPSAAPFEFCLGCDQPSLRASSVCPVSPCPRASMPPPEPPATATKKPATLVTGR
jgi:hypothetical protein